VCHAVTHAEMLFAARVTSPLVLSCLQSCAVRFHHRKTLVALLKSEAALQAIRRVLVSKACRGAIMFGDSLSLHQCIDLIAMLRGCALPFQWYPVSLCLVCLWPFPLLDSCLPCVRVSAACIRDLILAFALRRERRSVRSLV
jgi:hypothetical protein